MLLLFDLMKCGRDKAILGDRILDLAYTDRDRTRLVLCGQRIINARGDLVAIIEVRCVTLASTMALNSHEAAACLVLVVDQTSGSDGLCLQFLISLHLLEEEDLLTYKQRSLLRGLESHTTPTRGPSFSVLLFWSSPLA